MHDRSDRFSNDGCAVWSRPRFLTAHQHGNRHEYTAQTYVWTQSVAYPRCLPDHAHCTFLVIVDIGGCHGVQISARTDGEEDDEKQRLEMEESRHFRMCNRVCDRIWVRVIVLETSSSLSALRVLDDG